MAPKGAMKRPAAAGTDRPAKRSSVADPLAAQCTRIADAVKTSSIPQHVREMLAAALGGCLRTYKQDRHEFQTKLLEMVAEVLEGIKASNLEDLEAAEAKIAGSAQEKEVRESTLAAAKIKLQETKAEHDAKRNSHISDIEALRSATAQKKLASAEQANGDKLIEGFAAKKAKLEGAFSAEVFGSFKEKAGTNAAIKNFVKVCLDAGFEKALLESAPSVLQKSPEDRGTFGHLVVEQLEGQLTKHMESFTRTLDEMKNPENERASAVASAEQAVKTASEKKDASAATLELADAAAKDAKTSLAAAQKAVDEFAPELQAAQLQKERAVAMLKDLEAGALVDFATLLEHAPPAPVSEDASACNQPTTLDEKPGKSPVKSSEAME